MSDDKTLLKKIHGQLQKMPEKTAGIRQGNLLLPPGQAPAAHKGKHAAQYKGQGHGQHEIYHPVRMLAG